MNEARTVLQTQVNQATEDIVRDFERQLRRQVDVACHLTRVSPVASYVYASTDLAETGVRREQALVDGLRRYQRQFVQYVQEKTVDGDDEASYTVADLPVFSPPVEAVAARLAARSTDVLLLAVYAVLFFMLAFVSFLRTDIT
jgi:hypothetical protein